MRLFVDTNVLLDVLSCRDPFHEAGARVWSLAERGEVNGYISAISFNNVYYIVRRLGDKEKARKAIRLLRDVFEPVILDTRILNQSMDSAIDDFEDAIQFFSAVHAASEYLVTRNPGHFPRSGPRILSPEEFLAVWSVRKEA